MEKEELEVGMYVRTKYNGILKTEEIYKQNGEYVIALYNKVGNFVDITEIIGEPSFNIIDLIEEGDYIKYDNETQYYMVNSIGEEKVIVYGRGFGDWKYINSNDVIIKSIVTKEQFEAMEYKI